MPSLDTADRPLTQRRSMSAGATRRNLGLSVNTTFTTTPKKRIKRLVLGPGEDVPGGDQVNLSPEPLMAGERIPIKKGKKLVAKQPENTEIRKQRVLVKRKNTARTTEMLQHCDAEHEYDLRDAPTMPVEGSSRRAMAKPLSQATITRKEGGPLGLTIDENLVVTQVVRGTAAETAGLKAGIRLSTVDGVRIRTQEDAIQALRSAGEEVNLGISLETTAPAMRQEGIVAGVQTSQTTQQSARRSRRPGGRESSMPPFGCTEEIASVRKPTGLGPPGLGPQLHDWGEDGASRLRFKKSVNGNDPFKPNLYVPELSGSQQRNHQGNKTSYEVADERGETDADGTWSMKRELMRTGKQQTNKEVTERRNGDIITDVNNGAFVETPRRGKDRAASPMACRNPASGAPKGQEQKHMTGRRCNAESYRIDSELLHFNPAGTPTSSQRRTMTPGRYRHSPHDSGDFIGNRGFDPKPAVKTGIRSVPHIYDLPQPVPRQFRPTPRHQVSTPSPSDIFNVCGYRGDCKDTRNHERSRSARGVSPRNYSSINFTHVSEGQQVCLLLL